MTDPLTITLIITGIASAIVAILGGLHKFKIKCCCCQTDCLENETEKQIKDIKKIQKLSVSSIKSI
jgi:hypothetical protein